MYGGEVITHRKATHTRTYKIEWSLLDFTKRRGKNTSEKKRVHATMKNMN